MDSSDDQLGRTSVGPQDQRGDTNPLRSFRWQDRVRSCPEELDWLHGSPGGVDRNDTVLRHVKRAGQLVRDPERRSKPPCHISGVDVAGVDRSCERCVDAQDGVRVVADRPNGTANCGTLGAIVEDVREVQGKHSVV